MFDAVTSPPPPANETVRSYAPGSRERASLEARLKEMASADPIDLTMTVDGVVRVALDEVDVGARALREPARLRERRRREVQAGHPGAEPRQRESVRADVALQVHAAQPGDVAEPRHVEPHDVAEEVGSSTNRSTA